jgi:hypothetical protein
VSAIDIATLNAAYEKIKGMVPMYRGVNIDLSVRMVKGFDAHHASARHDDFDGAAAKAVHGAAWRVVRAAVSCPRGGCFGLPHYQSAWWQLRR